MSEPAVKLPLADELHAFAKELDPNFDARVKTSPALTAQFNRLYLALSRVDDAKAMTYRPGKRRS